VNVWVAGGTYADISVPLNPGVHVYGCFDPTFDLSQRNPLLAANLRQFDLDIIVGFAAQETIAVGTLIYGGVLERHPSLDVCVSHGGGATGYLFGRMASAARKRPWASESLRKDGAFESLLHRLWFDIHVHDDDSLGLLKSRVNPAHLVFGTNFAGWDQQPGNVRAEAAVYTDNARRLLRAAPAQRG